ncbi:WxL domain-containing protein [Enterococcus sp. 669A]|uniref:WxL domain-containing protein n=1 Tax=Candidatus Enterococcus moelleringii TaxID=2815325 RepID=A0ABS3LE26_9ENTE|nr:WxL domain-containing protein [Enterococcus sp. 669A]MBO1307874.1 WxL domain-containing protein [Enterococcus sp. 669A]
MKRRLKFLCLSILMVTLVFGNSLPALAVVDLNTPAREITVAFENQDGSELPEQINLTGTYITEKNNGQDWGDQLNIINSYNQYLPSAAILKEPNHNIFKIKIPKFEQSAKRWGTQYPYQSITAGFTQLKINTNLSHIKEFTLATPNTHPVESIMDQSVPSVEEQKVIADKFIKSNQSFILDGSVYQSKNSNYLDLGFTIVSDSYRGPTTGWSIYGADGQVYTYVTTYHTIKEIFENPAGQRIPVPENYTQDKVTEVISTPFTYTMEKGSELPRTYVADNQLYVYKGWYKGSGNKSRIDAAYPPTISFSPELNESKDEVHIVYEANPSKLVKEEYLDQESNVIEPSWNTETPVLQGELYQNTPDAEKLDSSDAAWVYQGWRFLGESMLRTTAVEAKIDDDTTIQYIYQKKQHKIEEKWIDSKTGNLLELPSNPVISPIKDNETFTKEPPEVVTDLSGVKWAYSGWENVTVAPGQLTKEPVAIAGVKSDTEIKYHYTRVDTTAALDVQPKSQIVKNGETVTWTARVTNTGAVDLQLGSLKLGEVAAGITLPKQLIVTLADKTQQTFLIEDQTSEVDLQPLTIPSGNQNYADITFETKVTGTINQVLPLSLAISGNLTAEVTGQSFVRIDDPDEPNLQPANDIGFVNLPDFTFEETEVSPAPQSKGLEAKNYQPGYQPYIRFVTPADNGNWSLTAKLSQFANKKRALPRNTALTLTGGQLKQVNNYNQSDESLQEVTSGINHSLKADGSAMLITETNGAGAHQLNYQFDQVRLEIPEYAGIAGETYSANLDWTLVTGP